MFVSGVDIDELDFWTFCFTLYNRFIVINIYVSNAKKHTYINLYFFQPISQSKVPKFQKVRQSL